MEGIAFLIMTDNNTEPTRISVSSSDEQYRVMADAVRLGDDYLVYMWGGEKPHIGAVAAAQPRASLVDPNLPSATASVLTYLGHKEDVVVKQVSEDLSSALQTNVVVTAGIHWDDLEEQGIKAVVRGCREVTEKLIAEMGK